MKKEIRFYNVIFPIWMLILFPAAWLIVLPANYVIDSLVLLLSFKLFYQKEIGTAYRASISRVWLFGFLADLIGCLFLFSSYFGRGEWWEEYIITPLAVNPFDNWFSLFWVALSVALAGFFIYLLNSRFSFSKLPLSPKQKRCVSLMLAVLTAPYLLFLPSELTRPRKDPPNFFTNHIVSSSLYQTEILLRDGSRLSLDSVASQKEVSFFSYESRMAVNTAKKQNGPFPDALSLPEDGSFVFFAQQEDHSGSTETLGPKETGILQLPVWTSSSLPGVYFRCQDSWYRIQDCYTDAVRAIFSD